MSAREAVDLLWLATWTGSLAMLAALLLRGPVRRRFGAGVAYALWALVPATWLALLLPAPVREAVTQPVVVALPIAATMQAPAPAAFDAMPLLLAAWLAGALATMAWQQHRFVRGLGALQVLDADAGVLRAQRCDGLPALIGLLQPRIVMPADVESRYAECERALMLAHERVHLRRGDAWVNALVALVRAAQWFNPLVHVAAGRLRHDQELACDERVVADHPQSRRAYADAMLKTLVAEQPVPLGCHWGITHPMKERIMMLRQDRPLPRTRLAGAVMVGLAALGTGFAAWSAQPARVVQSDVALEANGNGQGIVSDVSLSLDGGSPVDVRLLSGSGKPFEVRSERDGVAVEIGGTIQAAEHQGQPAYRANMTIRRDGAVVGTPSLIALAGKPARVRIGEETQDGAFKGIDLSMTMRAGNVSGGLPVGTPSLEGRNVQRTVIRTRRDADIEPQGSAQLQDREAEGDAQSRAFAPPAYPVDALKQGLDGTVVLHVDVDAQGNPTAIRIDSATPPGVFEKSAMQAVKQWRFNPKVENGIAIPGTVRVPITFEARGPVPPAPPKPPSAGIAMPPQPPVLPAGANDVTVVRSGEGMTLADLPADVRARLGDLPADARVTRIEQRSTSTRTKAGSDAAAKPASISISHEVRYADVDSLVKAGGRLLDEAESKRRELPKGYRWVDVTTLIGRDKQTGTSLKITADIFSAPPEGKDGPMHVGYRH